MSNKLYSYGKQSISNDDIQAVKDVLKSDWLTQGPKISEFEIALCEKFGSKYASAVSNGTASLHLTGLASEWKTGDNIITSPITFLASANCILYSNAIPDFVDIDSKTYTIDVFKLEDKIKSYKKQNKRIKTVIAVDYAGHPCDWESLKLLADKYEFQLVNDNCHALGAEYKNDMQYAVKYADVVCQSYHPVKHITTGEGGAILTNKKKIAEKIKILRNHGIVKYYKKINSQSGKSDSDIKIKNSKTELQWYYEMQMLGFNYRITDFQCALGISQLKKLDLFVKRRREIAAYYDKAFENDDRFIFPHVSKHSYHLYPLQVNFEKIKLKKVKFFDQLSNAGINCQVHYIPVHLQPYYRNNFGFKKGDFPIAEKFYEQEISIPMYPALEEQDLHYISNKLLKLKNNFGKSKDRKNILLD